MESCRPLMNKTRGRSRAHQAACVRLVSPRGRGYSRKSRGICRDVCAGRASPAAFAEAFAQVAQVPRHSPRRLRRSRWVPRHSPRRLRRSRWVPRHLPRRLRRSRKSRSICRDVCAGCASSKIFIGACLFVDNGRPAYGSPRANRLMACSMSPPRWSELSRKS